MSSPRRVPSAASRASRSRRADSGEWIEQVREWANIHLRTLLHDYAPDAAAKLRGNRCPCPMHGGTNPSLALFDNHDGPGELWHCHSKCGTSGGGVELVAALTNRDRMDVLRELAPRAGIYLDASAPRRAPAPAVSPPSPPRGKVVREPQWWETECEAMRADGMTIASAAEMHTLMFAALRLGPIGRAYLERRGLEADAAEAYGFRSVESGAEWARVAGVLTDHYLRAELASGQLDPLPTYFSPALLIPYRDREGRAVVAFNARAMTDALEAKYGRYRKASGEVKLTLPFNAPALDGLSKADTLHITEGEFNAYTLHTYGVRAVSFGSAGIRAEMADLLASNLLLAGRVVLWFDADESGEKGYKKFHPVLERHIQATSDPPRVIRQHLPEPSLDSGAKKIDVNDLHRFGRLAAALQRLP